MVTIVKHEWHQVDRQYCIELDADILSEIYPDMDEDEIATLLEELENGEADIEDIINEAWENDVELEWEHQYDDCWTDRKGGYDVTYEYGDEDSYHHTPPPPEPTHKCTKCKWVGQSYDADWKFPEDEDSEEEPTKICPMCESPVELTEVGIQEEKEHAERMARWAKEDEEDGDEVECYSCDKPVSQDELIEMDGQYVCPHCGEGWVEQEDRDNDMELSDALEELKREFEELLEVEDEESPEETNEVPVAWPFDRPHEGPKLTMEQLDKKSKK